jgi:hypothetical protein
MLHITIPFGVAILALIIVLVAIASERMRPVLLVRAQIVFNGNPEASYDRPMRFWEALRSLRFTSGIKDGFLCRVYGDSLSGYGVADGDLLALQAIDKKDISSAAVNSDGVVLLGNGMQLIPGKSIILLPFLQNGDLDAQRNSQKLRCFTVAASDASGRIQIFSRKLDTSGGDHTACHSIDALLGRAYANLTTSRFI